ncbi:MAG: CDP-archaeol synthase [bacterium]
MTPLIRRVISAAVLLGSVFLILFKLPSIFGVAVILGLGTVSLLEFYGILRNAGIPAFRNLGIASGLALIFSGYLSLNIGLILPHPDSEGWRDLPVMVMTVLVFAICVRQFPQKDNPQPLPTIACTLFGLIYVPFLLMFLLGLAFRWTPTPWTSPLSSTAVRLLLYLIVVVKASDVGAYFVGNAIGRHKLFPRISPGKTWEGLAGGLVTGVLASLAFFCLLRGEITGPSPALFGCLSLDMADAWILGVLLAAIGVIGDLVESLLKRSAGLKDSGHLLPGMGGILDVLDSLLFAGPTLYFYLRWCAQVV